MVDYSKLSDAEIAQKVFFWVNDKICQGGGLAHFFNGAFFYSEGNSSAKTFDPCNKWSDAGRVIAENRISIDAQAEYEGDKWIAYSVDSKYDLVVIHKNPLRAAMIVFLMMQDAKNG